VEVPRYDFTSHSRQGESDFWRRKRLILVEGLWLLRRPSLRRQFAVSIFIDCAPALQLRRRLERDVAERGRTERAVREQYRRCVRPMFERYVAPQARRANIVVRTPIGMEELDKLAQRVGEVLT
jgi:uridine kinase